MITNAFRHMAYLIMERYQSESPYGNNYDMYFLNILLEFSYWEGPTIVFISQMKKLRVVLHLPICHSVSQFSDYIG